MEEGCLSKAILKKIETIGYVKGRLEEIFTHDLENLLCKHNPIWDQIPEEVDEQVDFRGLLSSIYFELENIKMALDDEEG